MAEPEQPRPRPAEGVLVLEDREIRSIFSGLMLIMFLGAIDQTIVGPALPTIGGALGGLNLLSWVVTIYLLSATAVTPLAGKLTDLYGRREVIAVSVFTFLFASIGAALAPNIWVLIVMRAIQGLGGGGLISLAQTVIGDIVSARERGKYQAYISGMFAVAGLTGPLMGGFFAEYLSWRLIFWVNVPLSLIALYFCDRVLKRLPTRRSTHRLDYPGAGLLGTATVALLLMMSWGGHEFAWSSPAIFACLAITLLFGAAFVLRERVAQEPLVPLPLLANPVIRITSVAGFFVMMMNITLSIYVPLYFEIYERQPASRSGMLLLGLVLGTVTGSLSTGKYMRRTGRYLLPPRIGLGLASAGLAVIAMGMGQLPVLAISAVLYAIGLGLGLCFPVLTVSTQNAVHPRDLGVATATQSFFRMLGGTIGVSTFGALIIALLPSAQGVQTSLESIASHAVAAGARESLGLAFRAFFGGCAAVLLFTWVLMWRLPEIPLRVQALHERKKE
jgi:MFS family permease